MLIKKMTIKSRINYGQGFKFPKLLFKLEDIVLIKQNEFIFIKNNKIIMDLNLYSIRMFEMKLKSTINKNVP